MPLETTAHNRILVTGAVGFIGAHVCRRLLDGGHEVIGIDNFDPFYDRAVKDAALRELRMSEGFAFMDCDIRDAEAVGEALDGVEVVVHLAARAGVRPSIEEPALYFSINAGGTVSLLEACHQHGVRRFVLGSSSSVYGDTTPVPFSEDAPAIEPISPYAASKRAAELACRVYADLHGLTIACLRFFTVYGPRQRPDLAIHRFTRLIHRGEPVPQYGDGSTERDYTWIDDITQGVESAVEWTDAVNASFELFNLGASHTVRLDKLIQLIGAALDETPRIDPMPSVAGDVRRTCADITKSKRVLGYNPSIEIENGIERFVRWYLESQSLVK